MKAVELQRKSADPDASELPQNISSTATKLDVLEELHLANNPQQDFSKNKMAERVLVRLKQKLDGYESGSFLSSQGQVNFLIQSARDAKNLCRLFPGWQPWV